MKIGIPKEKNNDESRVGLTPAGVGQLVLDGNEVYVQKGAGLATGITDEEYISSGAIMVDTFEEIYEKATLIIKVEKPLECEIKLLRPHHILYAYLHLAAHKETTLELLKTGTTCIAFETIIQEDGVKPILSPMSEVAGRMAVHLAAHKETTLELLKTGTTCIAFETIIQEDGVKPILSPMSEVAGRMAVQVGSFYLQKNNGGMGKLLGGVPGVERGKVVVLGAGVAGQSAIKTAFGMGAEVTAIDIDMNKLRYLDDNYKSQITTLYSTPRNIEKAVAEADLLIGTVLIPGGKTPCLVTKKYINTMQKGSVIVDVAIDQGGCFETSKITTLENPTYVVDGVVHYVTKKYINTMQKGSVIVDVAIDQGGCFETSKITTLENPTYVVDGVVHYCVGNMAGAYPITATISVENSILKYAREIASKGLKRACTVYPELLGGINIMNERVTCRKVADSLGLDYVGVGF